MSVKKILVTGATGKTGSLVLQQLRQHPDEDDFGSLTSKFLVLFTHNKIIQQINGLRP